MSKQQDMYRGRGHATIIICVTLPYVSYIVGLHMLLLLHALIPSTCVDACFTFVLHTRTAHTHCKATSTRVEQIYNTFVTTEKCTKYT